MPTVKLEQGFAVWITGLPASGKSTVAKRLATELRARNIDIEVLESDSFRAMFGTELGYSGQDRDLFYHALTYVGCLLVRHGIGVIFDATANLRRYRDAARKQIPQFLEVYVATSLPECMARDPKGIYAQALRGESRNVPGLQAPYEPPEHPEVTVQGDEDPDRAAQRVIDELAGRGFLRGLKPSAE